MAHAHWSRQCLIFPIRTNASEACHASSFAPISHPTTRTFATWHLFSSPRRIPEHKALQDAGRVDLRRDNTKIVAGMTRGYTRRYFSALHLPRNTHIEGARILNHFDFSRRTSRSLPTSCKRWCTGKKTVASVHFICIASQYTLQECPRCVCTEFFVSVTLPFAGSEAQQVVSRILGDSGHNVVSR